MRQIEKSGMRSLGTVLFVSLTSVSSIAAPLEWKEECVGRSKLQLPSDVEIAGHAFGELVDELEGGNGLSEPQFPDGQKAGWSRFAYTGYYLASNSLTPSEIKDARAKFLKAKDSLQARLSQGANGQGAKVSDVQTGSNGVLAWSTQQNVRFLIQLDGHLLAGRYGYVDKSRRENIALFKSFAEQVVARPVFSIPKDSGVCLPFSFIRDNGQHFRSITATYRSKSYPDVSIIVQDASAPELDAPKLPGTTEAESALNEFWSQYQHSRTGRKVTAGWGPRKTQDVEIDGRRGLSTLVKITRIDGSTDFAYSAYVAGDHTARTDAPNLVLHVIREGSVARARGLQPVDEKTLLELAQRVASTIQTRSFAPIRSSSTQ